MAPSGPAGRRRSRLIPRSTARPRASRTVRLLRRPAPIRNLAGCSRRDESIPSKGIDDPRERASGGQVGQAFRPDAVRRRSRAGPRRSGSVRAWVARPRRRPDRRSPFGRGGAPDRLGSVRTSGPPWRRSPRRPRRSGGPRRPFAGATRPNPAAGPSGRRAVAFPTSRLSFSTARPPRRIGPCRGRGRQPASSEIPRRTRRRSAALLMSPETRTDRSEGRPPGIRPDCPDPSFLAVTLAGDPLKKGIPKRNVHPCLSRIMGR